MKFHTSPANPTNLDLVLSMMTRFYEEEHIVFEEEKARRAVNELLNVPSLGCVLLLKVDEQTIGYLVAIQSFILEFGGRQIFLDELYIQDQWRGQGYAHEALAAVETLARETGVRVLRLEVARGNPRALRLYERNGFELHDRYTMTKLL